MVLKEQELLQIDEKFLKQLLDKDPNALVGLSVQLSNDLKEALERLNQNPTNSSRPSSSLAPWDKGCSDSDEKEPTDEEPIPTKENNESTEEELADEGDSDDKKKIDKQDSPTGKGKAGKQRGSQGFGRT